MMRSLAMFLAGLLVLGGCAEPLTEAQRPYAGLWKSEKTTLLITPTGRLEYETARDNASMSVSGPIQHLSAERIEAGILFITAEFVLDGPPVQRDGAWVLVVDGEPLYRADQTGRLAAASQVPSLNELRPLVADNLDALGQAIVSRDFSAFMARSSMALQSQYSAEEMMQSFASFADQNIDLRQYMVGDFVLTAEPFIDENGALRVQGVYDEGPGVLTFQLGYLYAPPAWKPVGVNVNVEPHAAPAPSG